jgi:dihydropteroate synthase
MDVAVRIHRNGALLIVVTGLADGQTSVLRTLLAAHENSVQPGFSFPKPGELSLAGAPGQLKRLVSLLCSDHRIPSSLSSVLESRLDNYLRSDYKITIKGRVLDLGGRTHVMGVLNVTPDSFSDGGQFAGHDAALDHARQMAAQGADIIDIGGESTRPGAAPLSEEQELARIVPVIERLSAEVDVPLSVDTYKSTVADKALKAGASIVNDISGFRFSPDMARVVAGHGAAVVLKHIKGTPRDMQANPVYHDVIGEIRDYLEESAGIALQAGIGKDRIVIDPGIGFGKTLEHNLEIIDRLDEFRALGFPVCLGTSRKRFIGTVLAIAEPKDRVEGTAATVALGIERGAHIVRVHDVGHMVKVARMTDAIVKRKQ